MKALHPETVLASSRPQWRSRIQNHCCSWDFAPRSIRIQAHPGDMRNMRRFSLRFSLLFLPFLSISLNISFIFPSFIRIRGSIPGEVHWSCAFLLNFTGQRPLWISTNNELLPPESTSASDSSFESDNFPKVLWDARESIFCTRHYKVHHITLPHCYMVTSYHHHIISVQPKSDWATHLRAFNLESRGGKHAVFHDKTMQNNAWMLDPRHDVATRGDRVASIKGLSTSKGAAKGAAAWNSEINQISKADFLMTDFNSTIFMSCFWRFAVMFCNVWSPLPEFLSMAPAPPEPPRGWHSWQQWRGARLHRKLQDPAAMPQHTG